MEGQYDEVRNQMPLVGLETCPSCWLRLRFTAAVAILFALSAIGAAALERSAEIVESFQAFCTLHLPDFSEIDEVATALQLPARSGKIIHRWGTATIDPNRGWCS